MSFSGSCLCGAVSYHGDNEQGGGHCHCVDCRKTSGTTHGSHMIAPEDSFNIAGEVRFFEKPADSGNLVSRGFCPNCGSPVYSTNSGFPGLVFVRASTLDDPEVFHPQMVVYTSRAVSWNPPAEGLRAFPEMPPFDDMPVEA